MKLAASYFCLALAGAAMISCVVPVYPGNRPYAAGGYGYYSSLPSTYVGDAYFYGGRYYYGGRYESGRYYHQGRPYSGRYYHNGQYYYGGRHEHRSSHDHR